MQVNERSSYTIQSTKKLSFLKCPFFAEQRLLLLGKRIFTHPSIFTFNDVMNASGTKLLKLSKLSLRMLTDKKML